MPDKPSWEVQREWILSLTFEDLPGQLWNGSRIVHDPGEYLKRLKRRVEKYGWTKEAEIEIEHLQESVYYPNRKGGIHVRP